MVLFPFEWGGILRNVLNSPGGPDGSPAPHLERLNKMKSIRCIIIASIALFAALPASGQIVYCTQTKPTSVPGCVPALTASDLTLSGSWNVSSVPLGPTETTIKGIYIYTNGAGIGQSAFSVSVPFGTLCLAGFKRTSPACAFVDYSGTPNTCAGSFSLPLNCNAGALGISVGDDLNVQCWYRDPPVFAGADFTHAIFYTVQ